MLAWRFHRRLPEGSEKEKEVAFSISHGGTVRRMDQRSFKFSTLLSQQVSRGSCVITKSSKYSDSEFQRESRKAEASNRLTIGKT